MIRFFSLWGVMLAPLFIFKAGDLTATPQWLRDQASLLSQSEDDYFRIQYQLTRHGNLQAAYDLLRNARQNENTYWLSQLADLGSVQALYELAMMQPHLQKSLLSEAASQGHAASQYELSLISQSRSVRLRWLKKSADQGYPLAMIGLYQWYQLHEQHEEAMVWLRRAAEFDADSALLLGRMLWRQRSYDESIAAFNQSSQLGHSDADEFLSLIRQRNALPDLSGTMLQTATQVCHQTLQFVATSLDSFNHAKRIFRQFSEDQRLKQLPICANAPVWLDDVKCDGNWRGHKRLGCDLKHVLPLAQTRDFTHLALFADRGKANVRNGIMFMDLADTYAVFVHELAHFAGFIDEYPVNGAMAPMHCQKEMAPNLVFMQPPEKGTREDLIEAVNASMGDKATNENMHPEEELRQLSAMNNEGSVQSPQIPESWLQTGHNISLTRARTCNNNHAQAYKPVSELTFMEYHDVGVIPPIYLSLWRQQLENRLTQTPVYVNFAQYFQEQGMHEQAEFWQHKFELFRQPARIETVSP